LDIKRYSGFAAAPERVYPYYDAPDAFGKVPPQFGCWLMSANSRVGSLNGQSGLNDT
jgi:hypothetical protein